MIAPSRALAFATLRATFEQGAHTERAFREGAERLGLGGRDRAQAQRLAYGAVQRRGTADAAIERLAERSTRLLDPPVLAALRLGLYELLFADRTPDHAAVDQAVELSKDAGAAHAAGLVNAVLRRAAREREDLIRILVGDDRTPGAAAVAHSAPLWLARMWWEELGAASARALLAACNEPAEVALRASGEREAALAALRAAGVEAGAAAGPWPLAAPESLVLAGRGGGALGELVAAGALTPQSRGSAAVVEVLAPERGERVLDLCAGPGIKTGQIASAGRRAGGGASRSSSTASAPPRWQPRRCAWACAASRVLEARRDRAAAAAPVRPRAARRALLGPRRAGLAPGRALAQVAAHDRAPRRGPGAPAARRRPRRCGPGGTLVYATCTISRRENEERVAALLAAAGSEGVPRAGAGGPRRARARPRLARTIRAACSCAPTAIGPPGSSSPG